MGPIQTVFLVNEASEAALLQSFRAGRLYALSRTPAYALALQEFTVRQGDAEAISGGTLQASRNRPLEVRVRLAATDGREYAVRAVLVRNGEVAQVWAGKTPLDVVHREPFRGAPSYYRLDVHGPVPHQLLTNPIFVREG